MVLAQEEERRRIRHDLHDELGPSLASQTFQLDATLERIKDDPAEAKQLLLALKEQNKQLVADIRRLVYELRPPALDELGVAEALAIQTSQLDDTGRVHIDLQTTPDPLPELPAAVEVAAYRIAREAIINTERHSGARACKTILEATGTELIVTVQDDGIGIGEMKSPGVGLTSMRERTEELGGTFEVGATHPTGTRVTAAIPLVDASPSDTEVVGDAGTGGEAIDRLDSLEPDVVLMDIMMPDMNGIEATRRIRSENPETHVVMLTMLEDDDSLFAAMCAGAHGYILKGSDKADVLRTVRAVAEGLDNATIADRLYISRKTVSNHISNIFTKLHLSDRAQAIVAAREAGLGKGFSPSDTWEPSETDIPDYSSCRRRRSRAGKRMISPINSSTAFTDTPISLKGRLSSQKIG